jgi:hypothetical protein
MMETMDGRRDPTADLRFFGVVTASVTHELNNVNSTIEQIAGLLEDHLALLQADQSADPERLRTIHERIVRQTRRAAGTIERLNRFAHYADTPCVHIDLNGLVANLRDLAERLAGRCRIALSFAPAAEDVALEGDPFLLARLIFGHLEVFWENLPAGAEIEISTVSPDGTPGVELASPVWTAAGDEDPWPQSLRDLADRLAVSVADRNDANRRVVTLLLPPD